MDEDTPIPISPLGDDDERRRLGEIHAAMMFEHELSEHRDIRGDIPLEHRENLSADDVEHFVINFCLDHFDGKIDRLAMHVKHLKRYPQQGLDAIDAFLNGKAEPAFKRIPGRLLRQFLMELRKAVQE